MKPVYSHSETVMYFNITIYGFKTGFTHCSRNIVYWMPNYLYSNFDAMHVRDNKQMTRKLDKHANDFKLYCEIIVYDQFGPLYNVAQPLCGSFKAKFCNEGCVYKHFGWLQTDYQNVFKLLRD